MVKSGLIDFPSADISRGWPPPTQMAHLGAGTYGVTGFHYVPKGFLGPEAPRPLWTNSAPPMLT